MVFNYPLIVHEEDGFFGGNSLMSKAATHRVIPSPISLRTQREP